MDRAPWMSVLMPTYNGAAWVGSALESLCAGPAGGIEVIVVDDGSTDGTLDVVRSFATRLALRVAGERRAGNWVAGTNLALRAAAGRHACVLHQDDVWLPGRAQAVERALALDPPCPLLVHPAVYIDHHGARLGSWRTPFGSRDRLVPSPEFVERLLVQNFLAMPSPVFERQAALRAGGFDESLWYTADWDLWLRLGAAGPVRYLAEPLAGFRIHPGSQTLSRQRTTAEFRAQLRTVLDRHYAPWAAAAPQRTADRVRRVAEFSVEVNVALAAARGGDRAHLPALAASFLRLGPSGWQRYFRDSRLAERVLARRRA